MTAGAGRAAQPAGLVIQVAIERTEPLAGTASARGATPVTFAGWLDLLRALSELMSAAGQRPDDTPDQGSTPELANGRPS